MKSKYFEVIQGNFDYTKLQTRVQFVGIDVISLAYQRSKPSETMQDIIDKIPAQQAVKRLISDLQELLTQLETK